MNTTTTTPGTPDRLAGAAIPSFSYMDSPLGRVLVVGRAGVVTGLYLADHDRSPPPRPGWRQDGTRLRHVEQQLDEYFAGRRTAFDVDVDLTGTPFQLRVWAALRDIPYGHTISYGELARRIGRPTASRAVGMANGRNPVSIIVPCHRVVAADGGLGGYGWGTQRKAWLLELEGARMM